MDNNSNIQLDDQEPTESDIIWEDTDTDADADADTENEHEDDKATVVSPTSSESMNNISSEFEIIG
jgi:hypothetical protein